VEEFPLPRKCARRARSSVIKKTRILLGIFRRSKAGIIRKDWHSHRRKRPAARLLWGKMKIYWIYFTRGCARWSGEAFSERKEEGGGQK